MNITQLSLAGTWIIHPTRHADNRGWFQEWFKKSELYAAIGFEFSPVQANISYSKRGTVRGVHYSTAPIGQAKLVTVLAGEIDDYVVDIQPSSPTFGKWERVKLSAENGYSVLLSPHVGHAFHALTDQTIVSYLVTSEYNPHAEKGFTPFCPFVSIDWADTGGFDVAPKDADAPDLLAQRDAGNLPDFQ